MTPAAAAFNAHRSIETFRAWLTAESEPAARWLKEIASEARLAPIVEAADAFLTASAPSAEQLEAVVAAFQALAARALGDLQTVRAPSVGWAPAVAVDPPPIIGVVGIEANQTPVLTTADGRRYVVKNSSF